MSVAPLFVNAKIPSSILGEGNDFLYFGLVFKCKIIDSAAVHSFIHYYTSCCNTILWRWDCVCY
ncbi:hypothetical protein B0O99DRAFT_622170 [Bisporella sp. PMI_857]|nr:hypothetical protein B0O99DRAFT_622170 [Bisporella sp. PMI_857]